MWLIWFVECCWCSGLVVQFSFWFFPFTLNNSQPNLPLYSGGLCGYFFDFFLLWVRKLSKKYPIEGRGVCSSLLLHFCSHLLHSCSSYLPLQDWRGWFVDRLCGWWEKSWEIFVKTTRNIPTYSGGLSTSLFLSTPRHPVWRIDWFFDFFLLWVRKTDQKRCVEGRGG